MKNNQIYLKHILTAIEKVEKYTKGLSKDDFDKDGGVQDIAIRNFEVIGEAARNLSDDFKISYPEIPWREAQDFRNRLIHQYFEVDLDILWDTIQKDIPQLKIKIETLMEKI